MPRLYRPTVNSDDFKSAKNQIQNVMQGLTDQVNNLSEGRLAAINNANVSAPNSTNTPYAKGDEVRNSNPSELGTTGSKYFIRGWTCLVAGAPGTWVANRILTGN